MYMPRTSLPRRLCSEISIVYSDPSTRTSRIRILVVFFSDICLSTSPVTRSCRPRTCLLISPLVFGIVKSSLLLCPVPDILRIVAAKTLFRVRWRPTNIISALLYCRPDGLVFLDYRHQALCNHLSLCFPLIRLRGRPSSALLKVPPTSIHARSKFRITGRILHPIASDAPRTAILTVVQNTQQVRRLTFRWHGGAIVNNGRGLRLWADRGRNGYTGWNEDMDVELQ